MSNTTSEIADLMRRTAELIQAADTYGPDCAAICQDLGVDVGLAQAGHEAGVERLATYADGFNLACRIIEGTVPADAAKLQAAVAGLRRGPLPPKKRRKEEEAGQELDGPDNNWGKPWPEGQQTGPACYNGAKDAGRSSDDEHEDKEDEADEDYDEDEAGEDYDEDKEEIPKLSGRRVTSSSQHRGVSWVKSSSRWVAQITVDGKQLHLGYFAAEEEAAKAYREAGAAIAQGGPIPTAPARAEPSSQHRGVSWDQRSSKWVARIKVGGKLRHLGLFAAEEEAAKAYREAGAAIAQGGPIPTAPARAGGSSQHRGVHWHKGNRKWEAQIRIDGKSRFLGCFADEEEAAAAYREADDERRLRFFPKANGVSYHKLGPQVGTSQNSETHSTNSRPPDCTNRWHLCNHRTR